MNRIISFWMVAVLTPLVGCATIHFENSAEAIASMTAAKTETELLAKRVIKNETNQIRLTTSSELYDDAYVKYNSYLDQLKIAILSGGSPDVFESQGAEAAAAAKKFSKFVRPSSGELIPKDPATITLISAILVDGGLKIYREYQTKQAGDRTNFCNVLETTLRWKTWEDLAKTPNE